MTETTSILNIYAFFLQGACLCAAPKALFMELLRNDTQVIPYICILRQPLFQSGKKHLGAKAAPSSEGVLCNQKKLSAGGCPTDEALRINREKSILLKLPAHLRGIYVIDAFDGQ